MMMRLRPVLKVGIIRRYFSKGQIPRCPYTVLGIQPGSSKDEIKSAYLSLTKAHHPDVGGDKAVFSEVLQAYHVLGNEQRRKEYDTLQGYGQAGGAQGSSEQKRQRRPEDDDPVVQWLRKKYEESNKDVPPHIRGQHNEYYKNKKNTEEGQSNKDIESTLAFRILELVAIVGMFAGIATFVHRWNSLKSRGSGKYDEAEEDAYVEKLHNRVVRLSEADCRSLSLEELDMIARSSNYALPPAYMRRVDEYREAYKIPTPEKQREEDLQAELEYRRMMASKPKPTEQELEAKRKRREQREREKVENALDFNYQARFNSGKIVLVENPEQKAPKDTITTLNEKIQPRNKPTE